MCSVGPAESSSDSDQLRITHPHLLSTVWANIFSLEKKLLARGLICSHLRTVICHCTLCVSTSASVKTPFPPDRGTVWIFTNLKLGYLMDNRQHQKKFSHEAGTMAGITAHVINALTSIEHPVINKI